MSPEDRAAWDRFNRQAKEHRLVTLPCVDCTPEFAAEMEAAYRCNGFPGAATPPRPPFQPNRRVVSYPAAERLERRRASWRAYRARLRAKRGMTTPPAAEPTGRSAP